VSHPYAVAGFLAAVFPITATPGASGARRGYLVWACSMALLTNSSVPVT